MKKYKEMGYLEQELYKLNRTKTQYINDCKRSFLNLPEVEQEDIENASTDELFDELKKHNWTIAFEEYCEALKYELMRRIGFEVRI